MGEPSNAMQTELSEFVTDLDTPRPQPPVPYICKVPTEFHSDDEAKYFEPTLVSVGPLHYDPLSPANELKREFARNFIQRIDGAADAIAEALSKIEVQIQGCYKEQELSMGRENLLKIILVDGCFLVELLMSYDSSTSATFVGSTAARVPFITLQKDLLKFENQLPFFVLKALASLVTTSQSDNINLVDMALNFFNITKPEFIIDGEPMHLLQVALQASFYKVESNSIIVEVEGDDGIASLKEHLPHASQLQNCKIILVRGDSKILTKVEFGNRTLKIPQVVIKESTLTLFKNFIYFETFFCETRFFSSYIMLMSTLVKTGEDVEVLRKKKILVTDIRDADRIVCLFKDLSSSINLSRKEFYFEQQLRDLRGAAHWGRTPESMMKIVMKLAILYLTILQTFIAIVAFISKK